MASIPRISIVTACYNMADYIEQTIRSVVSQGYPNLEYIVIDGGSTDGTTNIIDRYSDKISVAISEPDDGQYHAIQKGIEKSTGDIMAWLNADDMYYPWALSIVGEVFEKFPDVDWIIGLPSHINAAGQCIRMSNAVAAYPRHYIRNGWFRKELANYLQQESMFWRRSLWNKVGGFDFTLKLAADFNLFTEFARYRDLVAISVPLAAFRRRPGEQKSSYQKKAYFEEVDRVCERRNSPPRLWNVLAKRSLRLRMLLRLLIWKKCQVIVYSTEREEWVLRTLRRPLSTNSLISLLLENSIR